MEPVWTRQRQCCVQHAAAQGCLPTCDQRGTASWLCKNGKSIKNKAFFGVNVNAQTVREYKFIDEVLDDYIIKAS